MNRIGLMIDENFKELANSWSILSATSTSLRWTRVCKWSTRSPSASVVLTSCKRWSAWRKAFRCASSKRTSVLRDGLSRLVSTPRILTRTSVCRRLVVSSLTRTRLESPTRSDVIRVLRRAARLASSMTLWFARYVNSSNKVVIYPWQMQYVLKKLRIRLYCLIISCPKLLQIILC